MLLYVFHIIPFLRTFSLIILVLVSTIYEMVFISALMQEYSKVEQKRKKNAFVLAPLQNHIPGCLSADYAFEEFF